MQDDTSANVMTHSITNLIQLAIANPIDANLSSLLDELERVVAQLPQAKQLQVAGTILAQLAELHVLRANQLLEGWEERYNPTQGEPILTTEMLQVVLRQTMALNLDGLLEEPEPKPRNASPGTVEAVDSVASIVEKASVLELLDTMAEAEAKQAVLAVSHAEDISEWVAMIARWMEQHQTYTVSLVELQRSLQMPWVNLWLGVLLGGYLLEQRGDFYQLDGIWVQALPC